MEKRSMRKLLVLISGMVMLFGVQVASATDLKVGVVDLKKVLADAPQVAAMRTKLQKQFDPKNKELLALQKDMKADMDKYNKDSAVMKDQEKKTLQDKIMAQQTKLRDMQTAFQKSLLTAEDQSMQTISKLIQDVVDGLAKSQNYDLIIAKGAVAYSNSSFDVTDKIVKALKEKK